MTAARKLRETILEARMFVGRQGELARLQEAIRKRESLLIWGASGAGKSLLLARAIGEMPENIAGRCILGSGRGSPQEILRSIVQGFAEDPLFRAKFRKDAGHGATFPQWVKQQTSLRLRGLLYRASNAGEYWLFLEDLAPMTHVVARVVKELLWTHKTPVYAIAPGWTYNELGHATHFYWNDRQRLHIGALSLTAAKQLLECSIQQYGLARFDLEGFRQDILEFSGMLPGAILWMCVAAGDSRYHFEGRIKTKLLHVDFLLNHYQGKLQPDVRSHHQQPEQMRANGSR